MICRCVNYPSYFILPKFKKISLVDQSAWNREAISVHAANNFGFVRFSRKILRLFTFKELHDQLTIRGMYKRAIKKCRIPELPQLQLIFFFL